MEPANGNKCCPSLKPNSLGSHATLASIIPGLKRPLPVFRVCASADSGRSRSAFRGDSDHDSWLIPISIPGRKRSPFLGQADQGSALAGRVIGMVRNCLWKRVWRRWTQNHGYLASEEEVRGARKASVHAQDRE